jgi:hypothetical protein
VPSLADAGVAVYVALVRRRLILAAALALTCAATASGAGTKTMVIRLKSVTVAVSTNDVAPKGPSRGDTYLGRFRLLNVVPQFGRKAGAAVGTEHSRLELTSATAAVLHGVVALPGGTIVYGGKGSLGSSARVPVVGGTGVFARARGTLAVGSGTSPLNTYRLTLP